MPVEANKQELLVKPPEALTDPEMEKILDYMKEDPYYFFNYIQHHRNPADGKVSKSDC